MSLLCIPHQTKHIWVLHLASAVRVKYVLFIVQLKWRPDRFQVKLNEHVMEPGLGLLHLHTLTRIHKLADILIQWRHVCLVLPKPQQFWHDLSILESSQGNAHSLLESNLMFSSIY